MPHILSELSAVIAGAIHVVSGADAAKHIPAEGNLPEVVTMIRTIFAPGLPLLAVERAWAG